MSVDTVAGGVDLIVGQCCYCQSEFDAGSPPAEDLHDIADLDTACQSLDRLRALAPRRTYFSHEAAG